MGPVMTALAKKYSIQKVARKFFLNTFKIQGFPPKNAPQKKSVQLKTQQQ